MKAIVAVIGGGECTAVEAAAAEEVGRLLVQGGAVVVCGGLGGVMEAAARGAGGAGGVTVGILPGTDPGAANRYIAVPIATGLGEARNAVIVQAAQALIAVGGGPGTLSEIALALRLGKPVVGLQDRFTAGVDIPRVPTAAAAAAWALERATPKVV